MLLTAAVTSAFAEEGASSQTESTAGGGGTRDGQSGQGSGSKESSRASARKPKGKRPSVREAEGTEAYDRFEANTVIKSRYQLNGESLEVDPD